MSTLLNQYKGDTVDEPNCFPLVHFHVNMYLYNKNGDLIFGMSSDYAGSDYKGSRTQNGVIELQYQFSNQSSPSSTQITIHNLTKHDANKFQKGNTISFWAGWENSNRIYNNNARIFKSTISTVSPLQDSSGDWIMSVTCQDGQKFDNETALSKQFKAESKSVRSNASGISTALRLQRQIGDKEIAQWAKDHNATISQVEKRARQDIEHARHLSVRQASKDRKILSADIKSAENSSVNGIRSKIKSIRNAYHHWVHTHKESDRKANKVSSRELHDRMQREVRSEIKGFEDEAKGVRAHYKNKRHVSALRIRNHEKAVESNLSKRAKIAEGKAKPRHARVRRIARRRRNHLRTRIASKKEKIRRARTKRKTKAKKRSSNGLHFKKNTYASTIIRRLAKIGHIPISKLNLIHNKCYTSGYTATGKPFAEIQNIVSDCDSNIWWPHGALVIGNFADHPMENFTLTPETGLIQPVEKEDDDDSDDDDDSSTKPKNKKQQQQIQEATPTKYDVTSVFLPFLTTGSEFMIIDPSHDMSGVQYNNNTENITKGELFQGEVVVTSGELDIESGSMPEAQFTVEYASAVQRAQSIKNKTKAQKLAQQKAAKDKKRRHHVKLHRAARRAKHKKAKKPNVGKIVKHII